MFQFAKCEELQLIYAAAALQPDDDRQDNILVLLATEAAYLMLRHRSIQRGGEATVRRALDKGKAQVLAMYPANFSSERRRPSKVVVADKQWGKTRAGR